MARTKSLLRIKLCNSRVTIEFPGTHLVLTLTMHVCPADNAYLFPQSVPPFFLLFGLRLLSQSHA